MKRSLVICLCAFLSGCAARRSTAPAQIVPVSTSLCWLTSSGKVECDQVLVKDLGNRHFLILSQRDKQAPCELKLQGGGVLVILPWETDTENGQVAATNCKFKWINGEKTK